jgi:acetylornithine aminotransferase
MSKRRIWSKPMCDPPPMFVKGEGCYLWDVENRKYLDLTAGIAVNALGHCDPETSKLIAQQVALPHL